jgi:adenylosuccinate synthase
MQFHAVIGANYGDEGKGLTTDWLCRTVKPRRVVRFNGGAQAGHTVTTRSGRQRHVFSTFGSGTLAGVPTELTRDVIINPYAALMERKQLLTIKFDARHVYYDHQSPITTPFEVAINQAIELRRGEERHGSCGLGINETVERHLAMRAAGGQKLTDSLYEPTAVSEAFDWIRNMWIPRRMWHLGFSDDDIKAMQAKSSDYLGPYIDCLQQAQQRVFFETRTEYGDLVYEGAQGLALDEELGEFPHVTRSNTGIKNVLHDIKRRLDELHAHDEQHTLFVLYPTRTYLTRHGRGPLPNEDRAVNILCGNAPNDETNFTNPWQESLRYAPLHVAETCARIKADFERNKAFLRTELPSVNFQPRTVLTCCDQSELVRTVDHGMRPTSWLEIIRTFAENGIPVAASSHGPAANTMQIRDSHFRYAHAGGQAAAMA